MPDGEIAETPATINVSRIECPPQEALVSKLRSNSYSENSTFGFRQVRRNEGSVEGVLISNSYTSITRIDPETGEPTEDNVTTADRVPFRIDLQNGFLEGYTDRDGNSELLNRLGQVVPQFVSQSLNLDIDQILEVSRRSPHEIDVSALRINNISPEPQTSGNCYLETYTNQVASELVSRYEGDVSYICLNINLAPDEEVTVGIYRSGSVRLFSNSSRDSELLPLIRDLLSEVVADA
ncbi:hypothetical protein [Halobaculum roseum]|uniref:Uncharacterized protein n=1 Tax=Halobaculum roseum TaxID=2175149 RepID=A0ABD5MLJ0_9EURY|nr:hypothetical protein [Halobaculum roseum]QZY03939.1 hypothetical protein K6T36_07190 [Halobaculum roseum]